MVSGPRTACSLLRGGARSPRRSAWVLWMPSPVQTTIRPQGWLSGIKAPHSMETIQHTRSPRVRQGSLPRLGDFYLLDRGNRSTLPFGPPDVVACGYDRCPQLVTRSYARNHAYPPRFQPSLEAVNKCARRQSRPRSRIDQCRFAFPTYTFCRELF